MKSSLMCPSVIFIYQNYTQYLSKLHEEVCIIMLYEGYIMNNDDDVKRYGEAFYKRLSRC